MWTKIVAGVVAALAVVGVGVYVAMPPVEGGCGKCRISTPQGESSTSELCPAISVDCSGQPHCCAAATTPVDADAFAACGGGLTAVPRTNVKSQGVCCSE